MLKIKDNPTPDTTGTFSIILSTHCLIVTVFVILRIEYTLKDILKTIHHKEKDLHRSEF